MRKIAGVVVNNSGTDANEIYNNSFDSVKYAIVASNQNRSSDGLSGLCLKCNDFSHTLFDQSVTSMYNPAPIEHGIAYYQGDTIDVTAPAGNRFSDIHYTLQGKSDINNESSGIIYFFHEMFPLSQRIFPDYCSQNVQRIPANDLEYSKVEACPSRLNAVPPDPQEMKEEIVDAEQESTIINDQLEALVDGGSTEETTEEIAISIPPDAMELRDGLLMKSPYLSDTVMKSAISKEDVLPNEMIRDILVENPQAAKNEEVIQEIENRFVPMPETMLDEIMEGVNIIGAKEDLEAHLSYHKQRQKYLEAELYRFYKTDTVNASSEDSLIAFLRTQNTIESRYQLVFEYIGLGETQTAGQVLDSIPQMFSLNEAETRQYEDYQSYIGILVELKEQGLPVLEVDLVQRGLLLELSANAEEPVQTYSRNALWMSGKLSYSEPVILPDEMKSGEIFRHRKGKPSSSDNKMILFPNPANDYIIVDYKLDQKSGRNKSCVLSILDFNGNTLFEKELTKPENQILVDCRHFLSGDFFCQISNGHTTVLVKKFLVLK